MHSYEYEYEWTKGGLVSNPSNSPVPQPRRQRTKRVKINSILPETHPLIAGAKTHFVKSRKPSSFDIDKDTSNYYLRPYKKLLADLVVSKNSLDNGLEIMNKLFNAFLKSGYRTVIAPNASHFRRLEVEVRENNNNSNDYLSYWSPYRITAIYIDDIAIGLTLFETSKKVDVSHSWGTTFNFRPNGAFVLQTYSPYVGTDWSQRWVIEQNQSISKQGKLIVEALYQTTSTIREQLECARQEEAKRKREWEEQETQYKLQEEKDNREKSLKQSNELLQQVIGKWAYAKSIETFFQEVEEEISRENPIKRAELNNRLDLARKVLSEVNALEDFAEWKSPDEIYSSQRKIWS